MDVKDAKEKSAQAVEEAKAKSKKAVEDAKAVIEKIKGNDNVDDLKKALTKGVDLTKKYTQELRDKTDLDELAQLIHEIETA